jgi:undecaprenyl-diphosphatase
LGAILAVVVLYWRKFFDFTRWQFYLKLLVGVIPALVLGFLFNDAIEALLESPLTVSIMLLVGGVVLLFIDKFFNHPTVEKEEQITYRKSFLIGFWQVVAMIPGVSRSAASIIGGMQQKLTRKLAAEFSFYLAVPTMFAATAYSVFLKKWQSTGGTKRGYELITESSDNTLAFVAGNVIAFVGIALLVLIFTGYLK